MDPKPRYRLAVDAALQKGTEVRLGDGVAHYLVQVLRLRYSCQSARALP